MNFHDFVVTVWQGNEGYERLSQIKDYLRRPRYYEPKPDQKAIEESDEVSETEENSISSVDSDGSISALDFDQIRDFSIKVPSKD